MEKSEKHYKQLSPEERATIMLMTREGKGVREVGRFLKRSPSTISRETDRDFGVETDYDASLAGTQASLLRIKPRKGMNYLAAELRGIKTQVKPASYRLPYAASCGELDPKRLKIPLKIQFSKPDKARTENCDAAYDLYAGSNFL